MESLYSEFCALNLEHASLLGIPTTPAGQKFTPKLAILFLGSLHDSDFFSTLLVLPIEVLEGGEHRCNPQHLATVLEAHTIVTRIVKKL
jgi:hypothetical protein